MNFCTLFDSYYIHKGLALYKSLECVTNNFHLYVMAFDIDCYDFLKRQSLPYMTVELLDNFEDEALLKVKPLRTKAEYCWTCGPSVIYYFINKYKLNSCTYLDSDLMFYISPQVIYDEIGVNSSVAITEHFHNDTLGGKYCVQFVYFKNDLVGIRALKWWREQCIEWCYSKFENGKYGDQKYLDEFPVLFDNVCIIKNRGVGIAPWNMNLYKYNQTGKGLIFDDIDYQIVFFHFHGVRIEYDIDKKTLFLKTITYDLDEYLKELFYVPYMKMLKCVYEIYFDKEVVCYSLKERSTMARIYSMLKKNFRENRVVQFIYYKILRVKYNGYESKII